MEKIWTLTTEWVGYGEAGCNVLLFHKEADARAEMAKQIAEEKDNDHLFHQDYCVVEDSENNFTVFADGAYCEDHWSITIEEKEVR